MRLCVELQKTEAELLRELVHEAINTCRLRRAARHRARRARGFESAGEGSARRAGPHLEELHLGPASLIFELIVEAWTDGRMTREVVLSDLLPPGFSEADQGGKGELELLAELLGQAHAISRRMTAEIRQKLAENPLGSRRCAALSNITESLRHAVTAFASRRTAAIDDALVRFAERPRLVVDFTTDVDSVAAAAGDLETFDGRTARSDTFASALSHAEQSRRPNRVIVLATEGSNLHRLKI